MFDPGEWTCHVCGESRPDAQISVHRNVVDIRGIEIQENVRFCNDRPECAAGAPSVHFIRP